VAILYNQPNHWLKFDIVAVAPYLAAAKGAVQSLTTVPYQRDWVEKLQQIQLKLEVAGTSRIEGADFTEHELDAALNLNESAEELLTRSQKQARAAVQTYRWIADIAKDRPVDLNLICSIHRMLVTDCDDDHCPPGKIRTSDQNVTFGIPRHRGCNGGPACSSALDNLVNAIQTEFQKHDPLLQALGLHYHIAAMHPFLDGNGRTARALESLMYQKAGLRDTAFIAMSNYYYEEKTRYLAVLAEVRSKEHDLTPFLILGLKGLEIQCNRLLREITRQMQKALFRDTMYSLFNRLHSSRKRVIHKRQIEMLRILLDQESVSIGDFWKRMEPSYRSLGSPVKAFTRDLNSLVGLGAIHIIENDGGWTARINLTWPSEITESAFFERLKKLPKGKTYGFLS
jgi:Fic family protein